MTVYCVIPVFNRLDATRKVLAALSRQTQRALRVIVVDDGSSDGTADYIRQYHPDVHVIRGDGNLWWSGAIKKGLDFVFAQAAAGDYVLLQNNDTDFGDDYIATLVSVSKRNGGAVVGSPLRDATAENRIFSLGPKISYFRTRVTELLESRPDLFSEINSVSSADLPEIIQMDALSGRGTLYPIEVLWKIGSVCERWLPHYWADYELSARARRAGVDTVVALAAPVWTGSEASGINRKNANLLKVLWSRKSQSNIIHTFVFFSLAGPWYYRITAVPRVLLWRCWAMLKRGLAP